MKEWRREFEKKRILKLKRIESGKKLAAAKKKKKKDGND